MAHAGNTDQEHGPGTRTRRQCSPTSKPPSMGQEQLDLFARGGFPRSTKY
jgi:hypothetical protein